MTMSHNRKFKSKSLSFGNSSRPTRPSMRTNMLAEHDSMQYRGKILTFFAPSELQLQQSVCPTRR